MSVFISHIACQTEIYSRWIIATSSKTYTSNQSWVREARYTVSVHHMQTNKYNEIPSILMNLFHHKPLHVCVNGSSCYVVHVGQQLT